MYLCSYVVQCLVLFYEVQLVQMRIRSVCSCMCVGRGKCRFVWKFPAIFFQNRPINQGKKLLIRSLVVRYLNHLFTICTIQLLLFILQYGSSGAWYTFLRQCSLSSRFSIVHNPQQVHPSPFPRRAFGFGWFGCLSHLISCYYEEYVDLVWKYQVCRLRLLFLCGSYEHIQQGPPRCCLLLVIYLLLAISNHYYLIII